MEAPKLPSFFKSKGPKQFNYRPWFYDPAKEEREKRNRMIRSGSSISGESNEVFKSRLHEKWSASRSGQKQRSKSNFRLLLIIAALLWISYYILN